MIWYERYGWGSNPFELKPMPDLISGFDEIRSELLEFVKSGDCCLLTGMEGMGKTTLLKWLEKYALQEYEPIYINTIGMSKDELKLINIDKIIRDKVNLLDKFRKKERNIVMLIDEAQALPPTVGDAITRNLDNNLIKSVVLAAPADSSKLILSEKIGKKKIAVRLMKADEAMGMILKRIGYNNPFDHESLEIIFSKATFIPKRILELCERIARANMEKHVSKDFVEAYFGLEGSMDDSTSFLNSLSPLQRKIVIVLKTGNHRPKDIAKRLKKPAKTITSQLAYLSLKAGIKTMKRKGIENPVVEKIPGTHAVYRLTDSARKTLIKE
ncbi:MAG: AAA family ATPase [Candidatus Aenigmatarchaeota archaeon]